MSSHHIVRDNQEPALIILGSHPPLALVHELLEWAPTVVVSEEALDEVLTWGIKLDVVLHHPPAPPIEAKVEHQQPVQLIEAVTAHGNLNAALRFLATRQHATVNIVCDDMEWHTLEAFKQSLTLVVYCQRTRWSFIRTGHVDKRVPAGTRYEIRSGEQATHHHSETGRLNIERGEGFWLGESIPD